MGFIYKGGGSGADNLADLIDNEFADRAARDAFYAIEENRLTLSHTEDKLTIILIDDDGDGRAIVEVWTGEDAPATYDNTQWAEITAQIPSASVIKTLYESNANTNAFTDLFNTIMGYLTDTDDAVVSSKSWQFPPDTVFVSENLGIEGAGEAFAVFDRANDRRGYLVAYERGIGNRPFFRDLVSRQTNFPVQNSRDTDSGSPNFTQNITLQANRLLTKVYLESTETVTGANIKLIRNNFVVAQALNLSFTANTIKEIDISQGIICPTGSVLTIDVEGVTLKGTGTGNNFEIFLRIDDFTYESTNLATIDDVHTENEIADIMSNVIVGGDNLDAIYDQSNHDIILSVPTEVIQDIIGGMVTGNTETGIVVTYDDSTGKINFDVTGGTQPYAHPSVDGLSSEIDGIHDVGVDLNGLKLFTYSVHNVHNIQGNLTLTVDGSDYTISRPTRDGEYTIPIDLSGISSATERTFTYFVTGDDTQTPSQEFTSLDTVTVTYSEHATAFWGFSATNNPSTINTGNMNTAEVDQSKEEFSMQGTWETMQWFIILVPSTHDIDQIRESGLSNNFITSFTKTTNVRTIGGVQYHSYVLQNVNKTGTIHYIARVA